MMLMCAIPFASLHKLPLALLLALCSSTSVQADFAVISYLATALSLLQVELVDYGMNSVSQGIDAMAITRVVIRPTGQNVKPGVTPQVL